MLALSRKIGESIIISDNIEITLLAVSGETAKLGITAPRSIPVHRKEVYEQIQLENREASSNINVDGFKSYTKGKPDKR
jgi:carbon storage regulator